MARMGEDRVTGLQKAAILLIALGPERSAGVFKHLKEEEIEELTLEIANTRSVTPQVKEMVINEFYEVCLAQQYIAEGGIGYAKELLEKMGVADSYLITTFAGKEAESAEIEELESWIAENYPDVEFYITDGGQEVYPFIFVVE